MKKKLLSNTYLNEAEKYQIKFFLDEEDKYVVIEIVPKNKNYALRIFLNDRKELVEYYFDIIKESGLDKETKVPYFIDLYLDITIDKENTINVLDEDELNYALKTNDITESDYKLVLNVKENLLREIKEQSNDLLNLDYMKYLGDM